MATWTIRYAVYTCEILAEFSEHLSYIKTAKLFILIQAHKKMENFTRPFSYIICAVAETCIFHHLLVLPKTQTKIYYFCFFDKSKT